MSAPLVYRRDVPAEIDQAFLWYERQRPGLGNEFLAELREYLKRIRETPESYGLLYQQVRAAPLRRFPYVIYYRIESAVTRVLAIQHGSRHPRRWKSRN